jgi:hypothetical protein
LGKFPPAPRLIVEAVVAVTVNPEPRTRFLYQVVTARDECRGEGVLPVPLGDRMAARGMVREDHFLPALQFRELLPKPRDGRLVQKMRVERLQL